MKTQLGVYRKPFGNLTLWNDWDRLFDSFSFPGLSTKENDDFTPSCDIEETEHSFLVKMDVPGIPKSDVHVDLEGEKLIIRGERKTETTEKKGTYALTERNMGKFERSFYLGPNVDASKIEASYKEGVLSIELPKSKSLKKPIAIKEVN